MKNTEKERNREREKERKKGWRRCIQQGQTRCQRPAGCHQSTGLCRFGTKWADQLSPRPSTGDRALPWRPPEQRVRPSLPFLLVYCWWPSLPAERAWPGDPLSLSCRRQSKFWGYLLENFAESSLVRPNLFHALRRFIFKRRL